MPASRKSTIDRSVPIGLKALRMWFALESRVAPSSAERRAARLFVTPPRQKRSSAGVTSNKRAIESHHQRVDVLVRDGNVNVWTTTIGSGPSVLLLHGWGGSGNDMMPIATALASAGFRCVVIDMPGHGRSPGRESSLVQFLGAIRAVTGSLGTPDLVVGHSFGGSAAVFSIAELELPVRGAVLIAPAPGPSYYLERFARTVGLPAERTDGMVRNLVQRVGRSMESLDTLAASNRATHVPALILHDPSDREVPFAYAEQMASSWPMSQLVPTNSGGHRRILRDPEVIEAALSFTEAVIASGS
jgi:pimeloyl-ACP methyl ester carboxylesterase